MPSGLTVEFLVAGLLNPDAVLFRQRVMTIGDNAPDYSRRIFLESNEVG